MQKEKSETIKRRDQLPETFNSFSEAANFWDNHDSTDYEDIMGDADFDIKIVFEPKWTVERLSPAAKKKLGIK